MQRTFGNRIRAALITGGASLILATATLAAPTLAADQPTTTTTSTPSATAPEAIGPHTHQLHGTVKTGPSAGAATFTLSTERYGDVTVSFNGTTPKGHGHAHGKSRSHELASLADLKVGERVVVRGRTSADGKTFAARRVHVLPAADHAKNGVTHVTGTVSSATATALTVKLADGTTRSVTVSADTQIRPAGKTAADLSVGTQVTVVSRNGTATGIVVMPAA